ncbi:MAG: DUF3040 domain-containing protein [Actinomycetota bacterium]|nr:DUF3040 domain-containing protein [Pseudonocardiales bacterium]MDQ2707263.1 DUF3040 domain-containing protein [Actinomycetota bacterium]
MPLSEHEQRLLDQIERALIAEDPKFASTVRAGRPRPTRRRRIQGLVLFVLGLVLLIVGVALFHDGMGWLALSLAGFLAMLGGAVLAVTSLGSGDAAPSTSAEPDRRFGGKMEERFRRRFEQE